MQTTFPKLLLQHASQRPAAPAMREKEYGIWQTLAWRDLAQMVEHLACGLHQAGLRRDKDPIVIHLYSEFLESFRLAARGKRAGKSSS
mgnify:CR=1 FL=1